MGIFGRMVDLVAANVNDLIDRAENPDKMIRQIIRELETSIDHSKQKMVTILAECRRLERIVDERAKEADEWTRRAEAAVDQGNDSLARKALERKLTHEKELAALQARADETRRAADQIAESIRLLEEKLEQARARKAALAARASAAQTTKEVQQRAQSMEDPAQALGKFDKLERRIQDAEDEASALTAVRAAESAVEKEFQALEADVAVEHELAALKAKRER